MEAAIQILQHLPSIGITITSKESKVLEYFGNLRKTLMATKIVKIESKSFRKTLAGLIIKFNPNSKNMGGFTLLINAARQLEDMNDVESQLMVIELNRIIVSIIVAVTPSAARDLTSLPSYPSSTLKRARTVLQSEKPINKIIPTQKSAILSEPILEAETLEIDNEEVTCSMVKKVSYPFTSKSWKILISEAIHSVPDQRMTLETVCDYLACHFEYFAARKRTLLRRTVSRQFTRYCKRGEEAERGEKGRHQYFYHLIEEGEERLIEGRDEESNLIENEEMNSVTRPLFSWKELIQKSLSDQESMITAQEIRTLIMKKYEYYSNLNELVRGGVKNALCKYSDCFKKIIVEKTSETKEITYWILIRKEGNSLGYKNDISSTPIMISSVIQTGPSRVYLPNSQVHQSSSSLSISAPSGSSPHQDIPS